MVSNRIDYDNDMRNLQIKYEKYLHYSVTLIMSDGGVFDGIIESIEQAHIIMLVGEDVMAPDDSDDETYDKNRQHGNVGYNRRPRRRSRRFRRRPFPFANVVAIELLPYIHPHPYLFY